MPALYLAVTRQGVLQQGSRLPHALADAAVLLLRLPPALLERGALLRAQLHQLR